MILLAFMGDELTRAGSVTSDIEIAAEHVEEARAELATARAEREAALLIRRGIHPHDRSRREFTAKSKLEPFEGVVADTDGLHWLVTADEAPRYAQLRAQAQATFDDARLRYDVAWAEYLEAGRRDSERALAEKTNRVGQYTLALVVVGVLQVLAGLLQACAALRH